MPYLYPHPTLDATIKEVWNRKTTGHPITTFSGLSFAAYTMLDELRVYVGAETIRIMVGADAAADARTIRELLDPALVNRAIAWATDATEHQLKTLNNFLGLAERPDLVVELTTRVL